MNEYIILYIHIANIDERPSTGVFSPRLLKVTADVHAPATNSQANNLSTLLQPCKAHI